MPIPVTFHFIEDEDNVIIDPDIKEEKICTSRNTIFMNVFGDICGIHTHGMLSLSFEKYQDCLSIAEAKAKEITVIMRETLLNSENFKIENLAEELENMEIDEGESKIKDATKERSNFIKIIKKNIKKDTDNEQVSDKLVVDTLKRKKIPKIGEGSGQRSSKQYRGKRDTKAKDKQKEEEDGSDEEEETVQMKSEFEQF